MRWGCDTVGDGLTAGQHTDQSRPPGMCVRAAGEELGVCRGRRRGGERHVSARNKEVHSGPEDVSAKEKQALRLLHKPIPTKRSVQVGSG